MSGENYYQYNGYDPAQGEPIQLTDTQRAIGLAMAEGILETLVNTYGMHLADYIVRVMFLGIFTTAAAHGLAPNLIMNDFERRVNEARDRLTMFIEGKIKAGEIGPR